MGGITAHITPYLQQYGYPILFAIVLVESFGIPAPGQTLIITAALLAATGHLNLWAVLITAFAAAVLGDSIGYMLGRRGGRRLLLRYGGWVGLNRHRFRRLNKHFGRYGGWFVTFARFFDVLRQINGILAGTVDMPFYRFLLFNAIGAALWVSLWGFGSYYLGRGLNEWIGMFDAIATWLVLAVIAGGIIFFLVWLTRFLWRRYRQARANHAS
ncbi:MAG: DedA family protein [Gammaproteobacteria bacterium]